MTKPFRTTRRIEFHDTDMAGIAHFTAFFRYMEAAEHELLRSLELSVVHEQAAERLSWPRVSAACDFKRPAHFEQVVEIEVRILRVGEKSITYGFTFTSDGELLAEGKMTSCCCRVAAGKAPEPVAIPEAIRKKLPEPDEEAA